MPCVFGMDSFVMEWVRDRAPHASKGWDKYSAIGISDGHKLIGGVVYHDFHGHCISASIATESPAWATRANLRVLFGYPFIQLGCRRLGALTGESNQKAQDMLSRLGFTVEGLHRFGFKDEHSISFGMLRDECKWIR